MRVSRWLLFLLVILLCSGPAFAARAAAPARPPAAPLPVSLQADAVELDLNRNTADATGHARLDYQNAQLFADHITVNRTTGDVHAEGHLELIQQNRRLTGDTLTYNLNTQAGVLTTARLEEQGVIIRGQRIEFWPQRAIAYHASFTTCDRPHPDYEIAARQIILIARPPSRPGAAPTSGRLTLKHAHVIYHGRRLFSLPTYTTTVGEIQAHRATLLPTGGFSHLDGPYALFGYSVVRPNQPVTANLQVRVTTQRGVRGFLDLRRPFGSTGAAEAYIRLSRREDTSETSLEADQVAYSIADVLVSREPEVGIRLLNHRIGRRLRLSTALDAGRYSELRLNQGDRHVTANRTAVTTLLRVDAYRIAPRLSLSHAVGLRLSTYSTADHLTIGFFRNTIAYDFGRERRFSLSYIERTSHGASPFEFDNVGLARELRPDLRYRLNPAWSIRIMDAYDLQRGRSRDMLVAATRTKHCLEYTVGWRRLRGTFFFGISLAPSTQPGAPPAEPMPAPGPTDTAPPL